ncbi:MAG: hypothetical protein AB1938_09350 [Myxococcota bacterium]
MRGAASRDKRSWRKATFSAGEHVTPALTVDVDAIYAVLAGL